MKQIITKEQVCELSVKQRKKAIDTYIVSNNKAFNGEFTFINPTIDYFKEVPEGNLEMSLLVPIDEMFPVLNLGQCIELIYSLTDCFPEYKSVNNAFEVTLFFYGNIKTYGPQEELIDVLWEVVKDIL